ncbi:VOC family protein [Maribacter sp. TH_r10]|uniref:VOC family protein n=1 Tax=Maribacter luteus TaxID=2594478 RepID=A0A6I2MQ64_9FLAO|nr:MULTISPECIES: VOC family protein [Maribacter]MDV7140541.1 VOC family protein [Maribacter sp. TH_r10]MRX64590.1 VOC family protein [Maribacter luteus]
MKQKIATIALIVKDYDEAISFYTQKLGFKVLEDTTLGPDKRWVLITPPKSDGATLLLAKATTQEEIRCIGNQAGGRVFLFLHTDDFWRDHKHMSENGVVFKEEPRQEAYGTVAVFKDLYGNLWDLIEPKS